MGKHTASRQQANTYDTKFHLRFVERLYDGSPRWWNPHWESTYFSPVAGDQYGTLNREPGVAKLIAMAHDFTYYYNLETYYLEACVNPICPLRSWALAYFKGLGNAAYVRDENDVHQDQFPTAHAREASWEGVKRDLKHMAEGKWNELQDKCPQCGHKQPVFPVSAISDKWVYVLKESGQSLTPYLEIFVESENSGYIYTSFATAVFRPTVTH